MIWRTLLIIAVLGGVFYLGSAASRREDVNAIGAKWAASGHADATAESWVHWDGDDPPAVPANCAKCHSAPGFLDYLGADGSPALAVDKAAPVGTVLYCHACHNEAAGALESAVFPSGAEVGDLGAEAVCVQCHQGLASGAAVDRAAGALGDDETSAELRFVNVHYRIAAATQMGAVAAAGYEYPGREYVGRFAHASDVTVCTDCHDPHSTRLDPDVCAPCHANVADRRDLADIRTTRVDYDGDGEVAEGISGEIAGLQEALLAAIQRYAGEVVGQPIAYRAAYPYWFADSDGDGAVTGEEASPANQYAAYTPRLLRAAYNYHLSLQDPGAYTHNARYVIQLLYDAVADLGTRVEVPTASLTRP